MDVNGSRFHSRLGERDWRPVAASSAPFDMSPGEIQRWLTRGAESPPAVEGFQPVVWSDAWAGVSLAPRIPLLATPAGTTRATPEMRRGAAADQFGNIFWIDGNRSGVRIQPAGQRASGEYWSVTAAVAGPPDDPDALFDAKPSEVPQVRLQGLAVTSTHYLLVGTLDPSGLLIFDLHTAGDPCWWQWPAVLGFNPLLLASDGYGGVLVLDQPSPGTARVWKLHEHLLLEARSHTLVLAGARPADLWPHGQPGRVYPEETVPAPVEIPVEDPAGLAALSDGSFLVLDAGRPGDVARLAHHRSGDDTASASVAPVWYVLDVSATPVQDGHALVYRQRAEVARGAVDGSLFLVTAKAGQVFEWHVETREDRLTFSLVPALYPLHRFGGRGLVAAGDEIFYDSDAHWLLLAEQPNPSYFPRGRMQGEELVFDGKRPACRWHRVLFDACIPAGCAVNVSAVAHDDPGTLESLEFEGYEPSVYLRGSGSELPFEQPFGDVQDNVNAGTFETLLQAAEGRYLKLRVDLLGTGRATPRVRALRVYYPRFSYLHEYLPAIYREDQISASFLDRYLANIEGLFTGIEGQIEQAERALDPATAPAEFLAWLTCWQGASLDLGWDELRQRLFLKHAWLLFRWRGTRLALVAWIRLTIEDCPDEAIFAPLLRGREGGGERFSGHRVRIVENFERRLYSRTALGDVAPAGPGLLVDERPWEPVFGAELLNQRWRAFLRDRYRPADPSVVYGDDDVLQALNARWELDESSRIGSFGGLFFPALVPDHTAQLEDWLAFTQVAFAFTYPEVRTVDLQAYREFLSRRYTDVYEMLGAYGVSNAGASSFANVNLPAGNQLPPDGQALIDWIEFVSVDLLSRRSAHRFTVLVPTVPRESDRERTARAARVSAVVVREKPAHTDFEVGFFWDLFQVGTARLGIDTIAGESSRYVAMVLNAGFLRTGLLAADAAWQAPGRTVVGRDRLEEGDYGIQ